VKNLQHEEWTSVHPSSSNLKGINAIYARPEENSKNSNDATKKKTREKVVMILVLIIICTLFYGCGIYLIGVLIFPRLMGGYCLFYLGLSGIVFIIGTLLICFIIRKMRNKRCNLRGESVK